jgi:hypothetical protein
VAFETALNFIWFALGVFALCGTLRSRRVAANPHGSAWLHLCGVALIIAALFPYVSATDDVLRIQHLHLRPDTVSSHASKSESHEQSKSRTSDALIRLYEIMDAPVAASVQGVSFSFAFVSLVVTPALRAVTRDVAFRCGRSPPQPLRLIHSA